MQGCGMAPHTSYASGRDTPRTNLEAALHFNRIETDGRTSCEGLCYLWLSEEAIQKVWHIATQGTRDDSLAHTLD